MTPRISVVMPVWNGEQYLVEALDSVFTQTFTDFELIVVDDGSTDRTPAILASYSDPRLKVHALDHGGIVLALNHGVAVARADWILRQDADDVSLPQRFAAQWEAITARAGVSLCFSEVEKVGAGSDLGSNARCPRTKAFTALRLCYQCTLFHTAVLFNKAAFLAAGGYLPEERHAEDYSLWGRMLERGEFVGLPQRLVKYRVHPQSVSKQNVQRQLALKEQIAAGHCRRFMRLDEAAAQRAHAILTQSTRARTWRDWLWFLRHCAPRLRWKSNEARAWLLYQTLKQAARLG